jgi:hypothetical protein
MNRLSLLRSFLREFVASMSTSACSERRSIIPRYPMRFSGKWGEATSFMHSSWPKWVG